MTMHLPAALAAVSPAVQNVLAAEFGRAAPLIPNCVDGERFAPGPREPPAPLRTVAAQAGVGLRFYTLL